MRATLLLLLLTATARADEPILCTGIWTPGLTEQTLRKTFGAANVVRGDIYGAEGVETPGTIVFPNDPARRIEIVWRNERQRRRPEWIRLPAESRWKTFAGIRNGMSLAEIEKLNGRAFQLSGFDWDYGGLVTDWRGGQLAKPSTQCRVQLQFDRVVPEQLTKAQERAVDATSGERELLSSAPALRHFRVRVSEIIIQYPD